MRDRIKVYSWIGGDKPSDVVEGAEARRAQGFTAVKMNGTDGIGWVDSPVLLQQVVERVQGVRALGLDVGVDFHGRVHKGMAKQLAKALEPLQPLFIEGERACETRGELERVLTRFRWQNRCCLRSQRRSQTWRRWWLRLLRSERGCSRAMTSARTWSFGLLTSHNPM